MFENAYRESKLKEYLEKNIPVTAIYESNIFDNELEYVLLADIRNIGGDLLRSHMWSSEVGAFKTNGLEKGNIIEFEGRVSEYWKGKGSKTIDYTLSNISNIQIIGNRLSSREKCEYCEYKIHSKDLERKYDDSLKHRTRMTEDYVKKTKNVSESKKTIQKLEDKIRKLKEKKGASSKIKQALNANNKLLVKSMTDLYKISQSKTVRDAGRLKRRMKKIIGNIIKCRKCGRKLNKCKC